MKSSVTKAFRKCLDRLPASVQEQADKAYELWREDPYHNSLQFQASQSTPTDLFCTGRHRLSSSRVAGGRRPHLLVLDWGAR